MGERVTSKEVMAITRHEKKSMFLRPSDESASEASTNPPIKHPKKNIEAGRPVIAELAHSRPHSDTMEACVGTSQAHEPFGRLQTVVAVLHALAPRSVQCHSGRASVKTEMKVCWASNIHARETRIDWRNWDQLNSPMQSSTVDPREGWCWFDGGASCVSGDDDDDGLGWERRGVESAIWMRRR